MRAVVENTRKATKRPLVIPHLIGRMSPLLLTSDVTERRRLSLYPLKINA